MIVLAEPAPTMFTVCPLARPGCNSPLARVYVPAGMLIVTVPPTLLARQVASRRLSGDGAVVIPELPHAPPLAAMSDVVDTVNAVAAKAGVAATPSRTPTTIAATAPAAILDRLAG